MYNLITIVLCFIIILLLDKCIKNIPEVKPTKEYPRKGFILSWIHNTTTTVNALFRVVYNKVACVWLVS